VNRGQGPERHPRGGFYSVTGGGGLGFLKKDETSKGGGLRKGGKRKRKIFHNKGGQGLTVLKQE